jgi:hypothetical protein
MGRLILVALDIPRVFANFNLGNCSLAYAALSAFFSAVSAISAIFTGVARIRAGACRRGKYVQRDEGKKGER